MMTWNIEGLKAHVHALYDIVMLNLPDMIFLSEPLIFQTDLDESLALLSHEYEYSLNVASSYEPLIPFAKSRAFGGTLVLWRKYLDPYITLFPTESTAILPIVLQMPGTRVSAHICIYLPTHGRDNEYVSELANLRNCLHKIIDKFQDPIIAIRGDKNVNKKNLKRTQLFQNFTSMFTLYETCIDHPTYHHFTGNGEFDSNTDTILCNDKMLETIDHIICKLSNPTISSHHDVIISTFKQPTRLSPPPSTASLPSAPRVSYNRCKVNWTQEGKEAYSSIVGAQLEEVRQAWCNISSNAAFSVVIQCTNDILTSCAKETNPFFDLMVPDTRPRRCPPVILQSKRKLNRKFRSMCINNTPFTRDQFLKARASYKSAVKMVRLKSNLKRDEKIDTILSTNPKNIYSHLRRIKGNKESKIDSLRVGDDVYYGQQVGDGFYHSMSALKFCDEEKLSKRPHLQHHFSNYEHILKITANRNDIPPISFDDTMSLLSRMKTHVTDIFGITPLHYLNAGISGVEHFRFLLNTVISDVSKATIDELNTALGVILYKGHKKDKNLDRSYRTISTCPLLAKSLDLYLRDLYQNKWGQSTALTQYQNTGSSHEMAALLITEIVQFSLNVADKPVYLLILDAQSAFDRCLRQVLCTELYVTGTDGSALLLINNRLKNRKTVYQWNGEMIGPAHDVTGFEQGGINSGDFYKLYNNEQLIRAQASCLGVNIKSSVISAVGQADDVILCSNNIENLKLLAKLTEIYCAEYRVKLVPSKTKLLGLSKPKHEFLVQYAKLTNRVTIEDVGVSFVEDAEHVGIIRSTHGNMPNILNRISCYKKALGAIGSSGMARSHRGNPAATIRVHKLYAEPILFTGLASLVLLSSEIKMISSHHKKTLQFLQRLHENTPRAVVYFLGGSLPAEALLHMRQLSLFIMICLCPNDPLFRHGTYILNNCRPSSKSWFFFKSWLYVRNMDSPIQLNSWKIHLRR